MNLTDRLVTVTTVVFVLPTVAGALWLLRDQPEWVWWTVGLPVGDLVGAVVSWVAYGRP